MERRLGPTILQLSGPALDAAIGVFAAPYDLHHPNHRATIAFLPAVEYLRTMGHLVRAYVEPEAWVREMAFEFNLGSVTFESDPPTLDELERLVEGAGGQLPVYEFDYRHADEDDVARYDSRVLTSLRAQKLEEMIEFDAGPDGQQLFASHQPAIDTSFGLFFGRSDPGLRVLEVRYAIVLHGLGFDHTLSAYKAKRSQIETRISPRSGLLGLLSHAARPGDAVFTPIPAKVQGFGQPTEPAVADTALWPAGEASPSFDHLTLWEHLAHLEAGGASLLVDAPYDGRVFPLLMLAPDWAHLMTFEPAPEKGRWRSSDWMAAAREQVLAALSSGRSTTVEALTDG